jgi:hypothetical protein
VNIVSTIPQPPDYARRRGHKMVRIREKPGASEFIESTIGF